MGVLLFLLDTQMEHFLPGSSCPYRVQAVTWILLAEGVIVLCAAVYTIVGASQGNIYGEIQPRDGNGNFISDDAIAAGAQTQRCHELSLYRALLDCTSKQVSPVAVAHIPAR